MKTSELKALLEEFPADEEVEVHVVVSEELNIRIAIVAEDRAVTVRCDEDGGNADMTMFGGNMYFRAKTKHIGDVPLMGGDGRILRPAANPSRKECNNHGRNNRR